MTLQEIYKNQILLLPKKQVESKNFIPFLTDIFEEYIKLLENVNPQKFVLDGSSIENNLTVSIKRQKELVSGIIKTLTYYFDGKPYLAADTFFKTLDNRVSRFKTILNFQTIAKGHSFYRIRLKNDNEILPKYQIFHIPFELRGNVSTQRYSIPGFPSLYLSESIYVAWQELNKPKLDEFQVVRLESTKSIKYLDLTSPRIASNENSTEAFRYLMTWPLIAACSIRVKKYSDNFKPEYLIPQLLLQWARETREIDGIKYNSTHIESKNIRIHPKFTNLVMPVKVNSEKGFCTELQSTFNITETLSWQLYEIASGGSNPLDYFIEDFTRRKMPRLEIIKGIKSDYEITSFGKLENYLLDMETQQI